eukprot:CAMPEP_0179431788 /NCGR_PEP_ID=MMETSP0799-20121207/16596_1 /TAXON_ID=46947 /ORGANISM="Geminigera cryophila, Strain CCMP2564" /LENGTH=61 /DNA_ID=CAMNT_0021208905 /DNA_START=255 /DNA_END=440 /DNA_ORIENTATION=+
MGEEKVCAECDDDVWLPIGSTDRKSSISRLPTLSGLFFQKSPDFIGLFSQMRPDLAIVVLP